MADFKFSCPGCGQHIACDTGYSGMQINCPTCKQNIVVPQAPASATPPPAPRIATPPPPPSSAPGLATRASTTAPAAGQRFSGAPGAGAPLPKKKSGALKTVLVIAAVIVVLAALGAGGWFGYSKYKSSRGTKANPAAQVATPTAQATIQALSILTKVRDAYTNLNTVKSTGMVELFLDISNITEADVSDTLSPAAQKNPNRHPPGMPKIITNYTTFSMKWLKSSNWSYFAGDAISKVDRQNFSNTFAFWKSDQGQFMFQDMHMKGIPPMYRQMADSNAPAANAEQIKAMQDYFAKYFGDPANISKIVKDLGQTADESVNGFDCYTLTARVLGQKVKMWVDKTTYMIPQWQITLGGQLSDADVDDVFSVVAGAFTNIPAMTLNMIKTEVKKHSAVATKIRGVITSTANTIEVNPALTADDFTYDVPAGVRLVPMFNPGQRTRRNVPANRVATPAATTNAAAPPQ